MGPGKNSDILNKIRELETLAESVLELKRMAIPRRPIVIEFCGAPKSGKSSAIGSLDLFLRRNKFRTKVLTERAGVCPVYNKYDPYFNIWTFSSCIAELSVVLSNHPKDYDIILIDRGIFDALCWFTWQLQNNHLDETEYKPIVSYLTMSRWRSIIDLVYVFTAEPDVSLDREYALLLTRKLGSIMKTPVLESFRDAVNNTLGEFQKLFRRIEIFDTSSKEQNEVSYDVTKGILDILLSSTSESICYLFRSSLDENLPQSFLYSDAIVAMVSFQFGSRPEVEDADGKVQPIPIVVITNKNRDAVFVVKKKSDTTSEFSPESEKLLLYLGGHVRDEDVHANSDGSDFLSIARFALHREIKEETGIDYYPSREETNPLCIWIRSNDRSKRHLAICYVMEADFSTIRFKLDKNEFATTGSTKSGKVIAVKDLFEKYHDLEDWSQIILKEIFGLAPLFEQGSLFDR